MAEIVECETKDAPARRVALKRLLPALANDPLYRRMFMDEARIAGLLEHPNIVGVVKDGVREGEAFIAYEYVDGMNARAALLEARLAARPMPEMAALYVLACIARALEHAASRCDGAGKRLGIVHRDVSPDNILYSWDGDVKLSDFGIAWAEVRWELTQTGLVKGKLAYMSPEQAAGRELTAAADVYSLGISVWELLTGTPQGITSPESRTDIRLETIRLLDSCLHSCPQTRPGPSTLAAGAEKLLGVPGLPEGRRQLRVWLGPLRSSAPKGFGAALMQMVGAGEGPSRPAKATDTKNGKEELQTSVRRHLADRFDVLGLAGTGGMGSVYEAFDRVTGCKVAVKVLRLQGMRADERFQRETAILADLDHAGIVRYVAHGATAKGQRYLAMEWLEGESLEQRLDRAALSIEEATTVCIHSARSLGFLHARGIVHRDVKPSNLFLVDRRVDTVKLLDFGIAQLRAQFGPDATVEILGTLGYYAPEQARGSRALDARADVFSLGCVLFRCLAGFAPFVARDPCAILAKVLFEEAPPIRTLAPAVPEALDELLMRVLSKNPADRPADGDELAEQLALAREGRCHGTRPRKGNVPALTATENHVLSVVVAKPRAGAAARVVFLESEAGAPRSKVEPLVGADETIETTTAECTAPTELGRIVEMFDGRIAPLADGSLLATVSGASAATDQAATAARMALAMRPWLSGWSIALATGRGDATASWPLGEAVDRAAALLSLDKRDASGHPDGPICIDEVTAGLLDCRFEIGGDGHCLVLVREREPGDGVRKLLGRPTPCVGRDGELGAVRAIFEQCVSEPHAHAVLVTGPAGIGKSRLRYEFVRELAGRAEVLLCRADSLCTDAPFGLLAQGIRRDCGILDGEPIEIQRKKIRARVARHVPKERAERVAEFLGEIVGAAFDAQGRDALRSARQDPASMNEQMRSAFEEYMAAACEAGPVLVVLEDLHWGDAATVQYIDRVLRVLKNRALMVLALARPEVRNRFPELWSGLPVTELRLGELSRSAAQRLVCSTLGDELEPSRLEQLVELSCGNPFFLEEFVRAEAEGMGDAAPETVVAMVEMRLRALPARQRLLLRAASVFGGGFWKGGLARLLGETAQSGLEDDLTDLAQREIITQRVRARFAGEPEYTFRHDIVREVSYAMFTEADRALGHELAGEWLEEMAEPNAAVLAEHYQRAGNDGRSAMMLHTACKQALDAGDWQGAIDLAKRGLRCEDAKSLEGAFVLVLAEAHGFRGEYGRSLELAEQAYDLLPRGSDLWWLARERQALAAGWLGDHDRLLRAARELRDDPPTTSQAVRVHARTALALSLCGLYEQADEAILLIDEVSGLHAREGLAARGMLAQARATLAMARGDLWRFVELTREAASSHRQAGDLRRSWMAEANLGYGYSELGQLETAEFELRRSAQQFEQVGIRQGAALALSNLGVVLARKGQFEQARQIEQKAIRISEEDGYRRTEGSSRTYLAVIHMLRTDIASAEREARAAVAQTDRYLADQAHALAVLSRVLLAKGDATDEALRLARQAFESLSKLGGSVEEGESAIRLAFAEALHAAGDLAGARVAIAAARDRLVTRAEAIPDETVRDGFLSRIAENVRIMATAREWLREDTTQSDNTVPFDA